MKNNLQDFQIDAGDMEIQYNIEEAKVLLRAQGYHVEDTLNSAPPINEVTIIKPTLNITHKDLSNGRWYHLIGAEEDVSSWRPSVTTQLSVLDKGSGFDKWNRNLGHLAPMHRDAAGIRGSHVHYWMKALIEGSTVKAAMILNHILEESSEVWRHLYQREEMFAHSIRRYLASFCAFWKEKKPVPVAVEYPIYDVGLPFAGRFDMLLKFKKAKNSKKESLILVDLKTGAPYPSHAYQNSAYKVGWEKEHPEMPIDYIAGLYVKDSYRGDPTYTLTFQKDSYDAFLSASHLWCDRTRNVKGDLLPALREEPPTEFSIY